MLQRPSTKEMYKLSVSPEDAPDHPDYLELLFEQGHLCGAFSSRVAATSSALSATTGLTTTGSVRFGSCAC